jgi:hypothetical protein
MGGKTPAQSLKARCGDFSEFSKNRRPGDGAINPSLIREETFKPLAAKSSSSRAMISSKPGYS